MFSFFRRKKDVKLFFHTDVHNHLLPGVDHGAQSVDDSIKLIERLMAIGINKFVFTPHVTARTFENTPETIKMGFDVLNQAVNERGLDIDMQYSAEYRMDEYWLRQREEDKLIKMPNDYLLLENSYQQEMMMMDDIMFDLRIQGYKPMLAHPERYSYYSMRHDRYRSLHNAGVKFQVNLLSLAGFYGSGPKAAAEWLIDNKFCDFLGSDMHNEKHAEVLEGYLASKEWARLSKKLQGALLNDSLMIKK
jgi:tyrosine-protein phosphatase YwqE